MKQKERIAALERLITGYQESYYNGEAEIADAEFDLLWDELKTLAPESPILARVGGVRTITEGFPKARHRIPMGSQDKAANPQAFLEWAAKIPPPFVVQYKLDGASLELQYHQGELIRAITRGDGVTGDDITPNARRMTGVVAKLDIPFSGGVRGEVVMTRGIWREKYGNKANCRNAANGLMRRKDGAGAEDLTLIAYDAAASGDDGYFSGELAKIAWLSGRGFRVAVTRECASAEDVIAYRAEIAEQRKDLDVDIDGLVVKDSQTNMEDLRRARPERQIAFKFDLEVAVSVLRDVEWSESGATYTPIGIVDEVRLAGTKVKRANLNNPDMIRALGLKIGSPVLVVKRGEIIPKIEGLAGSGLAGPAKPEEERDIVFPVTCDACGSALEDRGARLFCPNPECPKRLRHRIERWVAVLDIRELGEKLIRQLFDCGRVRRIADLYTLNAGELAEMERMGELSAGKVIRHIQTRRELPLAVFVAGFDFEGIAVTTMEKVCAAGFNTLAALRAATVEGLAAVYGLGEISARGIVEALVETREEMDQVLAGGIITIAPPPCAESQPLKGMSFCFTGELRSLKRSEAEERIKALGASAKSSVVQELSFLVTNDPSSGSAKNKKARQLNIPILDEDAFLALLRNSRPAAASAQGVLFTDPL